MTHFAGNHIGLREVPRRTQPDNRSSIVIGLAQKIRMRQVEWQSSRSPSCAHPSRLAPPIHRHPGGLPHGQIHDYLPTSWQATLTAVTCHRLDAGIMVRPWAASPRPGPGICRRDLCSWSHRPRRSRKIEPGHNPRQRKSWQAGGSCLKTQA